jgi:hypothetical protein
MEREQVRRQAAIATDGGRYLQVLRAHGGHVGNSENEAYCVEDVRFAGTVETSDGVEALVPTRPNHLALLDFYGMERELKDK